MQEVDLTSSLLLEFSQDYIVVPVVTIPNLRGMPHRVHVLALWICLIADEVLDDTIPKRSTELFIAFTAWLCGTGRFIHPDSFTPDELSKLLANTVSGFIKEDDDGS